MEKNTFPSRKLDLGTFEIKATSLGLISPFHAQPAEITDLFAYLYNAFFCKLLRILLAFCARLRGYSQHHQIVDWNSCGQYPSFVKYEDLKVLSKDCMAVYGLWALTLSYFGGQSRLFSRRKLERWPKSAAHDNQVVCSFFYGKTRAARVLIGIKNKNPE